MNFFIAKREACIAACQRALVDLATAQQTIHLVRIPSESASVSTGRLCARVINSFCGGCFTPLVCCRITLCVVCHFGSVCHLPLHLSFLQLLPLLFFYFVLLGFVLLMYDRHLRLWNWWEKLRAENFIVIVFTLLVKSLSHHFSKKKKASSQHTVEYERGCEVTYKNAVTIAWNEPMA